MRDGSDERERRLARARQLRARWFHDPVLYAKEVHGITCWDRQCEILYSVAHNKRTAVKAGQKVSKSHSDALIASWWVMTRPRGKVLITAPTAHQIRDIIWPELQQLYERARFPLGGKWSTDPSTGWRLSGGRRVWGFSADKADTLQGASGDQLLIIVDEATGFREQLWPAVEGNLGGGGRLLATSNPNNPSGYFFEAFGPSRELWNTLTIASTDSPNYKAGRVIVPGLATREYVDEMRIAWGEDSPAWKVRIRGQFPEGGDDQVVTIAMVDSAQSAWIEMAALAKIAGLANPNRDPLNHARLELGVDVARFGSDETVVQPRRGNWMPEPQVRRGYDTGEVTGLVMRVVREDRRANERVKIKVDGVGIGAGVVDNLRREPEVEVVEVQAGASPTDDRFVLMRDQLWWGIREYTSGGGALPHDNKLVGELTAPTYKTDARGRIRVASKDQIKAKLGRSPDRADAVAMAIYSPMSSSDVEWASPPERGTAGQVSADPFESDDDDDPFSRW